MVERPNSTIEQHNSKPQNTNRWIQNVLSWKDRRTVEPSDSTVYVRGNWWAHYSNTLLLTYLLFCSENRKLIRKLITRSKFAASLSVVQAMNGRTMSCSQLRENMSQSRLLKLRPNLFCTMQSLMTIGHIAEGRRNAKMKIVYSSIRLSLETRSRQGQRNKANTTTGRCKLDMFVCHSFLLSSIFSENKNRQNRLSVSTHRHCLFCHLLTQSNFDCFTKRQTDRANCTTPIYR